MFAEREKANVYFDKMRLFTNQTTEGLVTTTFLKGSVDPTKLLIFAGIFPRPNDRRFYALLTDDSIPLTPQVAHSIYQLIMEARIISEPIPRPEDNPAIREFNESYQAALDMPSIVLAIGRGNTRSVSEVMNLYSIWGISPQTALAEMKFFTNFGSTVSRTQHFPQQ